MKAPSHRWALAVVTALSLALLPRPGHAAPGVLTDPEARTHFEQAQRHFDEQDYASAIPELKAAYALEPNPMLLYAWAQAERLAGSCARAAELYRRFLETDPAADQRQLAEANLLDCEAELPDSADPTASEDELETLEDSEPADPEDDVPRRPWYADPTAGVLAGVGLTGVIAGSALMSVARRKAREAPNAAVEDDYYIVRLQAERMNTAGIVMLSVGSALVVGGVIRYAVLASRGRGGSATAWDARWRPVVGWSGVGLSRRF